MKYIKKKTQILMEHQWILHACMQVDHYFCFVRKKPGVYPISLHRANIFCLGASMNDKSHSVFLHVTWQAQLEDVKDAIVISEFRFPVHTPF